MEIVRPKEESDVEVTRKACNSVSLFNMKSHKSYRDLQFQYNVHVPVYMYMYVHDIHMYMCMHVQWRNNGLSPKYMYLRGDSTDATRGRDSPGCDRFS